MKHAGDEVMQAANRIRAFDRTAATCCDLRIYGQHYSGLLVHEVLSERDSRVDAFDLMRARGLLFEGRGASGWPARVGCRLVAGGRRAGLDTPSS